jgi:hypothetical protein
VPAASVAHTRSVPAYVPAAALPVGPGAAVPDNEALEDDEPELEPEDDPEDDVEDAVEEGKVSVREALDSVQNCWESASALVRSEGQPPVMQSYMPLVNLVRFLSRKKEDVRMGRKRWKKVCVLRCAVAVNVDDAQAARVSDGHSEAVIHCRIPLVLLPIQSKRCNTPQVE